MYIEKLYSEEHPSIKDWGDVKNHVVLNIVEEKTFADGEEKVGYRYDCVERVPQPLTITNIVQTAINSRFNEDDLKYIMTNSYKTTDKKVVEFNEFAQKISKQAEEMGYVD